MFTDPGTLETLSRRMERHGFLPGKDIARTFDLLRANDLVFRYVVDGWLLGEKPPSFDLLAWNADSTNLPGKAHGEFLRKAYIENALAHDEYTALGERLMVSEIEHRLLHRRRHRRPHRAVAGRRTAPRSCSRDRCAS